MRVFYVHEASFPPQAKVEAESDSPYASIYSTSGFDIMGVLVGCMLVDRFRSSV